MRKSLAVLAALGFLGATTVAPVIAAPTAPAIDHTDISAAKKKAKPSAKKSKTKKSELVTDLSAAKKKAKKASSKKRK